MGNRLKCALIVTCAAYGTASANVGNYEVLNGPPYLADAEHATVAMARERVTCVLEKDYVNVEATFTFKNDGPATDVKMYFPLGIDSLDMPVNRPSKVDWERYWDFYGVNAENPVNEVIITKPFEESVIYVNNRETGGGAGGGVGRTFPWDTELVDLYRGFKASADGEPLRIRTVMRFSLAVEPTEDPYYLERGYTDIIILTREILDYWSVPFSAGATRVITCAYRNKYDDPYDTKEIGTFTYPVFTGKGWAGPIGEGEIEISYITDEAPGAVFFSSPGLPPAVTSYSESTTRLTWSFKGLEPEEEAAVNVRVGGRTGRGTPAEMLVEPGILKTSLDDSSGIEVTTAYGEKNEFAVLESRGEWWYVKLNDGAEGWLRWREVDAATGEEHINAAFAYYLTE